MSKGVFMFALVLLFIVFSCGQKWQESSRGFEYRYLNKSNGKTPQNGEILYYHVKLSESQSEEYPDTLNHSTQIFRMVDTAQLKVLDNPLYYVLAQMSEGEVVQIKVKKQSGRKYPDSYGSASIVYLTVHLRKITDESTHNAIEREKRETIQLERLKYSLQEKTIDNLVLAQRYKLKNQADTIVTISGHKVPAMFTNQRLSLKSRLISTQLVVSYAAFEETGKFIFSSFANREPLVVATNSDKIPPGWRELLKRLLPNEEIIVLLPAALLYGDSGFQGNIEIAAGADMILWFRVDSEIVNTGD